MQKEQYFVMDELPFCCSTMWFIGLLGLRIQGEFCMSVDNALPAVTDDASFAVGSQFYNGVCERS